jgi:hypothetical protein
MVGDRSAATNCTTGRQQDRGIAPRRVASRLCCDRCTAPDQRSGIRQSIRRDADRRLSEDVAKLGDLPADITPHVLRHSFASLAADLGYNEPTIATLLGHKAHSVTSRYVHSSDAVLLVAADAVANASMNLMKQGDLGSTPDQAQAHLRGQHRDRSVKWDGITVL